DGACAVEAACGKTDQRHRALARIARLALAGDPMYALRPYRNAAFLAGCTFEQREIEFAALELALQVGALVGAHVEPQRRMRARAGAAHRITAARRLPSASHPCRCGSTAAGRHRLPAA